MIIIREKTTNLADNKSTDREITNITGDYPMTAGPVK